MNDPKPESFKPNKVAEECQSELDTLKAENKALKEQLDTVTQKLAVSEKQIADGETDQALLRAERDRTLAELANLKENPPGAIEQPSAPAGELSEQIPQIINFLKQELPPDTKWPKRVMPKLREFLESKEG